MEIMDSCQLFFYNLWKLRWRIMRVPTKKKIGEKQIAFLLSYTYLIYPQQNKTTSCATKIRKNMLSG